MFYNVSERPHSGQKFHTTLIPEPSQVAHGLLSLLCDAEGVSTLVFRWRSCNLPTKTPIKKATPLKSAWIISNIISANLSINKSTTVVSHKFKCGRYRPLRGYHLTVYLCTDHKRLSPPARTYKFKERKILYNWYCAHLLAHNVLYRHVVRNRFLSFLVSSYFLICAKCQL